MLLRMEVYHKWHLEKWNVLSAVKCLKLTRMLHFIAVQGADGKQQTKKDVKTMQTELLNVHFAESSL